MQNKTFVVVLGAVLAVFLGAAVFFKQSKDPVMGEMMKQQVETMVVLKKLEEGMSSDLSGLGKNSSAVLIALQDLQRRVTLLESKIENMAQQPQRPQQPQVPDEDFSKVHNIPVDHSPVRGVKGAPITIVEFADFQCPFCSRFHAPILEVLKAYPDKVNYILKNFPLPFHPEAKPAAKAAFAAGEQGKYFEMVDAILKDNSGLNADKYKELAKDIGLNADKFTKDLSEKDAQYEQWIAADMQLVDQVDVRGTPTFFLNGKKTMARDLASFQKEIDAILNAQK